MLSGYQTSVEETNISETQFAPNQTGTSLTAPTTKAKPKTTAAPKPKTDGIAYLHNSAPLTPQKTNCKPLDDLVDRIFSVNWNENMK